MKKDAKSIIRYLIVGGTTTFTDFVIYMLLSLRLSTLISKLCSMGVAMVISFMANKNWTFEHNGKTDLHLIMKFAVAQCINICTNVSINQLMLRISGRKIVAFVIATGCATCVNYLLQKKMVFRNVSSLENRPPII